MEDSDLNNEKIASLMATFKNMEEIEDSTPELSGHLEREFLDIIRLFASKRKQMLKTISLLKKENKYLNW